MQEKKWQLGDIMLILQWFSKRKKNYVHGQRRGVNVLTASILGL